MERLEDGRFLYASRPYQLLNFQLQPEVVFRCRWDGDQLSIVFEQCTIHGLGRLQELVQFQCQAWIRPEQQRLMAKADLSLNCPLEEQGSFAEAADATHGRSRTALGDGPLGKALSYRTDERSS